MYILQHSKASIRGYPRGGVKLEYKQVDCVLYLVVANYEFGL